MKYNLKQTALFLCSLLMIFQSCSKKGNAPSEEEMPLTFATPVNGVSYSVKSESITGSIFKDDTNNIYWTDTFSVFKIEDSKIDLTARYNDGRGFPQSPLQLYLDIDEADNLYVLNKKFKSATVNEQSITKYDSAKKATVLLPMKPILLLELMLRYQQRR
ncbi:MAG: hypothetical protein H7223_05900 [Pedobacter sp.]|nr:hypothetical protein [Pedobacter sp.]